MSLLVTIDGQDVPATAFEYGHVSSGPGSLNFDVAPGLDETFTVVYDASGFHTVKVHRSLRREDMAIIDDFLIDSFARGFAKGG